MDSLGRWNLEMYGPITLLKINTLDLLQSVQRDLMGRRSTPFYEYPQDYLFIIPYL